MPVRGQAITEKRNVTITVTGAPMSIDAYHAVNNKVELLEALYHQNPSAAADLTAQASVFTGKLPFKIYTFNVTTVYANGEYTFTFVEERPNVDNEL